MKKILILTTMLLVTAVAVAQTNYYPNASGTITKTGYTYKYRNQKIFGFAGGDRVELFNASTTYLDVEWGNRDGSKMSLAEIMGDADVQYISSGTISPAQTYTMVENLFTSQQKTMLKGKSMVIELRVDPSTGKVADVYFSFFRNSPFVNIPVETYRSIELALKQNLTFTITPAGKKLNYTGSSWSQEF